jgi:hypothetical protein
MPVVRWTHKACLLTVVVAVLATTSCGTKGSTEPAGPAAKDVSIMGCGRDAALGTGSARGVIKNTTAERADYVVHIDFVDAKGAVIDSALHAETGIDSGADVTFTAIGVSSYPDQVTCKVTKVDRVPAK